LGFELGCDGAKVLLAALFNLQKTGLSHDPRGVWRCCIVKNLALGNLRHAHSFLEHSLRMRSRVCSPRAFKATMQSSPFNEFQKNCSDEYSKAVGFVFPFGVA
jgi:hypothetical protein